MTAILPHIVLDRGHAPKHSIIWLHGLGADGEDFVGVAEQMNLPVAMRYIFPHAPKSPVTINGGFVMRSWYDIVDLDIGAKQDAAGIRASQAEIEKFIAQEKARGIAAENIFLAGFSQGGGMAWVLAITGDRRWRGIIPIGGYVQVAVRDEVLGE